MVGNLISDYPIISSVNSNYLLIKPVAVTRTSRCKGCGKGLPLILKKNGDKVTCAECGIVHNVIQKVEIKTYVESEKESK
jgi:phage FluMu protein Com